MKRCKHNIDHHSMTPIGGESFPGFDGGYVETLRCVKCRAWLSLGPANDGRGSNFAIKVEIRAAELAVMPAGTYARNDEWAGWSAHDNGDSVPWDADGDESQCWHAGWLARCIATHNQRGSGGE